MTCADFKDQVMALALGALDAAEQRACEEHLRSSVTHEGCLEALAEARATVARMDGGLEPVSSRVWAEVDQATAPPSETKAPAASIVAMRKRERRAWFAAAAAMIACIWAFGENRALRRQVDASGEAIQKNETVLATVTGERQQCQRLLDEAGRFSAHARDAVALLERPGSRVVTLAPMPGKAEQRAVAVYDAGARRAMVVVRGMAPPQGKALQLWVIRGDQPPVPAGFLEPAEGMSMGEVERAVLDTQPDAFAVSLEPAGGSKSPTEVLMVGKLAG